MLCFAERCHSARKARCSLETGVSLGVSGAGVGLGVGFLDASTLSPMSLGLAHGRSSKEERVCAYYNYNLELEREKERVEKETKRGVPEGDFMISSSIVRQDPPALMILARAASEKRRAATSSLGTSKILMSSVTVPTTTAVRDVLSPRCLTSLLRETGGRLVLEATNLLWMVLQNAESDLLERNLKSYCAQNKRNRLSMHGSVHSGSVNRLRYWHLPSGEGADKDSCS